MLITWLCGLAINEAFLSALGKTRPRNCGRKRNHGYFRAERTQRGVSVGGTGQSEAKEGDGWGTPHSWGKALGAGSHLL